MSVDPQTFGIGRSRRGVVLMSVGSCMLIAWIYSASLRHFPRADQWCYLVDTVEHESFLPRLLDSYSYSRTRRVAAGDAALFRPMLFVLLAAEQSMFGNDFALWHAVGILMHLIVFLLMIDVMNRLDDFQRTLKKGNAYRKDEPSPDESSRSRLAVLLALFFALNVCLTEQVIWSHVNGYILFTIFVLISTRAVVSLHCRAAKEERHSPSALIGCWLAALAASFTYEIGQFFAPIVGLAIVAGCQRRWSRRARIMCVAAFFAIPLIYQLTNRLDAAYYSVHNAGDASLSSVLAKAISIQSFNNGFRYFKYTIIQPFFPDGVSIKYGSQRVQIAESIHRSGLMWVSLPVIVLWFHWLLGSAWKLVRGKEASVTRWPQIAIVLLLLSICGLHAAATVFGRMNLRPHPLVLSSNSHFAYMPLMFFILGSYALWTLTGAESETRRRVRYSMPVFMCGLVVLTVAGANRIVDLTELVAQSQSVDHDPAVRLQSWIDEHANDEDFDFALDIRSLKDMGHAHGLPVSMILFHSYIDNDLPEYIVRRVDGAWEFEKSAGRSEFKQQLFPDLVEVGWFCNFYRYDGEYFGIRRQFGVYDPDRSDQVIHFRGKTITDVLEQENQFAERLRKDLHAGLPVEGDVRLLEAAYHGFNIIGCGIPHIAEAIYAIPQSEGAFEANRVTSGGYSQIFRGFDIYEVKAQIDAVDGMVTQHVAKETDQIVEPNITLLLEGHHSYNIVGYGEVVYGIRQGDGPFDIERVRRGEYDRMIRGKTVSEVKTRIASSATSK